MEHSRNEITAHLPGLRRYAMSLARNPADADELVQETLCRAIERMRPWRCVKNSRAYLYAILHNLYIDRFIKSGARNETVSEDVVQSKLVVAPSQFYRIELRELDRAVRQLPQEHREVILLVGLEGMTYSTTAAVLGIPVGTVMSRLSRARDTLRRLTDRQGEEAVSREFGSTNGASEKSVGHSNEWVSARSGR